MRLGTLVGGVAVIVGLAGCGASSHRGQAPASAVSSSAGPLTGFGATSVTWHQYHQGDQYSAVTDIGGRVISYRITWPQGTTLAGAEQFILGQLPPGTKRTNSFTAKTTDGQGSCLLVNYQSPTLATLLASEPFNDPLGAIGAYLETVTSAGTVAPLSDANVNFGGVSLGWNRGTDPC